MIPRPMLPEPLAHALTERLASLYGARLARVVVFGSYARGDATPESDLDVLVVLQGELDRFAEAWRLSDLTLDFLDSFGVHVAFATIEERTFEEENWPLLRNVRREGVALEVEG